MEISQRSLLLRLALAAVFAIAVLLAVPGAASAEVTREILENPEPTDLVNITPIRIEADVTPGASSRHTVSIFNDSDGAVELTSEVINLAPPADKTLLADRDPKGEYEFGARDWVSSELGATTLQPFELVKFDIVVQPPDDAPVGSSYAGIDFVFVGEDPDGEGNQVAIRTSTILQLLLTVPGPIEYDLKLVSAQTRDTFHFGDSSFVSYGVRYRNDGTVSEHVKGDVTITSIFGNEAAKIDMGERALIRGATGTDRIVWTDTPMFGIFSAKATIVGDDGKPISKDMGRVVLMPPWWVIALVIAALVLPPVYLWWRRRQEWLLYLEEEEDEDVDQYAAY